MLSRPVSRVGCPNCSYTLSANFAVRTSTHHSLATRPTYKSAQRRLSSSKASCPPGNGRPGSDSTTGNAQTAGATEQQEQQSSATKERRPSSTGKRKAKYSTAGANTLDAEGGFVTQSSEAFTPVPSVPPTSHLHEKDVKLSSFFALHRPMSIHNPIPQPTSPSSFASIFQQPPSSSRWKPADVMQTLNTAVMNLDGTQPSPNSQNLHDSVLSQSSSHNGQTQSANGPSHINIEEIVSRYRPFNKPPAPIPLDPIHQQPHHKQAEKSRQSQAKQERAVAAQSAKANQKTYTTTLTISESTDHWSGAKSYSASATPVVEEQPQPNRQAISNEAKAPTLSPTKQMARQPFLHRMHARSHGQYVDLVRRVRTAQQMAEVRAAEHAEADENPDNGAGLPSDMNANEPGLGEDMSKEMLLISVKRRRKLKMKKHKYKKLMKRTRVIRRREGRM